MIINIIKIYFQNFKFFLRLSLFTVITGILSLGILLPVFQTGFGYVFRKMAKGESVYYKDILKFSNKILILFALYFVLLIIFVISIIGIFLPVFVFTFFMYSPYILANEETGIFKAMQRSCEIVIKNDLFKHLFAGIFLIIFFIIGLLPLGLGIFFTFPMISGYIGLMYEKNNNI
jgi:uncharacterized membrane protein